MARTCLLLWPGYASSIIQQQFYFARSVNGFHQMRHASPVVSCSSSVLDWESLPASRVLPNSHVVPGHEVWAEDQAWEWDEPAAFRPCDALRCPWDAWPSFWLGPRYRIEADQCVLSICSMFTIDYGQEDEVILYGRSGEIFVWMDRLWITLSEYVCVYL
jgi:hypothetical protein